jgi:predicted HAD superfamily Cof-like phosphohydrolase
MNYMEALREFHNKFDHYQFFGYEVDPEIVELRYKLIDEEVNQELLPALIKLKDNFAELSKGDWLKLMVEISDAVADSLYVIFGTCLSLGIPINKVFAEVHRSNMTKSMDKDMKSIKGKTLKGSDFSPPVLLPILERHMSED